MPIYTIERRLPSIVESLRGEHPAGPEPEPAPDQVKYSITLEISQEALEKLKRDIDRLTDRIERSQGQDRYSVYARRRLEAQREFIHSVGWSIRKFEKDRSRGSLDEESGD